MQKMIVSRVMLAGVALASVLLLTRCQSRDEGAEPIASAAQAPLLSQKLSPLAFTNPHAHIPAQCYVETSRGTQNACQFCHTNRLYLDGLGNNNPQAGLEPRIGNLQLEYSFVPLSPFVASPSINPWENTLRPETLALAVSVLGIEPANWDMAAYIRDDNWSAAFAQRPGDRRAWDPGHDSPFRLFPGLDPADLPADADGFVRSATATNGFFEEEGRWNTGWRAVNFMPYGIFTPLTGSVSGIYLRLPAAFMKNAAGEFDSAIYAANLELLERAIQDRLMPDDPHHYLGGAANVTVERGLYPLGTEFAHPLHYVDVAADGRNRSVSPFPGTRSRRVKEIRYMYKWEAYHPGYLPPGERHDDAPVAVNSEQGWLDNGAGWYLAGFIEDAGGTLRPQRAEELMQCLGCHSGTAGYDPPRFTSGTGNTIDSTWAFPRKFPAALGWKEMDYLGYSAGAAASANATPGTSALGDPLNRRLNKGEFRHFLDNVVGASLYGEIPNSVEAFMQATITKARGYGADWPALSTASAELLLAAQAQRLTLMREMTARGDYLDADRHIAGALLYPTRTASLEGARRYRQVVVTQRYTKGKDVHPETPVTFRYHRTAEQGFTHQDGRSYEQGEVIADRPIHTEDPADINYLSGRTPTLIDANRSFADGGTYHPDYSPLLAYPLQFK